MKGLFLLAASAVILLGAGCLAKDPAPVPPAPAAPGSGSGESPDIVFCTQDAKLCPDGSYVSRHGPNCEFDPCP